MEGSDLDPAVAEFLESTKEKKAAEVWHTVPSRAKTRRVEKDGGTGAATLDGRPPSSGSRASNGSSAFASLEDEAKQRRARIEAKRAEMEEASKRQDEADHDDEEDEDLEFDGQGVEGKGGELDGSAKPKKKKPKAPRVSVSEAAAKISTEELSAFLAQISEAFADAPDVRLMRCADFFARAFAPVTPSLVNIPRIIKDSSLPKALEVPYADVPEAVVAATVAWLNEQPTEAVGKFVVLLVNVAVEDLAAPGKPGRGGGAAAQSLAPAKAKVGMLVLLSVVLRKKPDVLVQVAESIRGDAQLHTQERLPLLAWAYGQAAAVDLPLGMWLWSRNLLPLAAGKQSSPLTRDVALTFLEAVLSKNLKKARPTLINGAVRKGERVVPPAALELYLRLSFPAPEARTKATARFADTYQLVKDVALAGSAHGKSTKAAAQQLLPLIFGHIESDATREEACSVAIWCLGENSTCYEEWEKLHWKHPAVSATLLEHVVRAWPQIRGRLEPFDGLQRFLRTLREKHAAAAAAASGDPQRAKALAKAAAARGQLESKLSWVPGCIKSAATLVAVAAMAYGFYLLSPPVNPWGWDGYLLLSKTHGPFRK